MYPCELVFLFEREFKELGRLREDTVNLVLGNSMVLEVTEEEG